MNKSNINLTKGISLKSFLVFLLIFVLYLSFQNICVSKSLDDDNDGYSNELELSYDTNPENPDSYPLDTDGDEIPNNDSSDGNFLGDLDDDNDGIDDSIEKLLKSDPLDSSDIIKIKINLKNYFLVDNNADKIFDKLYDPIGKITPVIEEKGVYFIDLEMDGIYDYQYSTGEVNSYDENSGEFQIPWILVIVTVIIVIVLIIALLFKLGILYLYEEYVEE